MFCSDPLSRPLIVQIREGKLVFNGFETALANMELNNDLKLSQQLWSSKAMDEEEEWNCNKNYDRQ